MDKKTFDTTFKADLEAVKNSERITKAKLQVMSRYMLEALHSFAPDIRPVNDLLDALTPMNRDAATAFFVEFSGFTFSKKDLRFTSKDKKNYFDCVEKTKAFLEDPLNNIWSWSAQNLNVQKTVKPFDPKEVEKSVEKQLKKARQEGIENAEVTILLSVLEGGISADTLTAALLKLQERKEEFAEQVAN